jgi:hypothetical protein
MGGNGVYSSLSTLFRPHETLVRIFILEGLLTIAISAVATFLVPAWPQKAKWVRETVSRGHCPTTHTIAVDRCRALSPSGPLG